MAESKFQVQEFLRATKQFRRGHKQLDDRMKEEFRIVSRELTQGNLSKGRNLKKLKGLENCYSVRLNRSYRFVFQLFPDGKSKPIAVGAHDELSNLGK